MAKRKGIKRPTMIYKAFQKKLNIEQCEPHQKTGVNCRCSCSTSYTRSVTPVYTCSDKSRMRIRQDCNYDISDTEIPEHSILTNI